MLITGQRTKERTVHIEALLMIQESKTELQPSSVSEKYIENSNGVKQHYIKALLNIILYILY